MPDEWMTTTEVAQKLGVSAETVRRHIHERRLRALALVLGERSTFRIRRSDFEAFRASYARDTIEDDWE